MYQSHWGLRETPFRSCLDRGFFYPSPTHDEALARLHFLVEQRRRLGLLLGESGSGKSLLYEVFAAELRRAGCAVAQTSLLGVSPAEWLWQSIAALERDSDAAATIGQLWQILTDRITEYRYQQIDTVLLLDDADRASREVLDQVARLVRFDRLPEARLTIVLACRPEGIGKLGGDLLELSELRIDIEPWEQTDTENYVRESLTKAGGQSAIFDDQAVARLQELTHGVPRRVSQLADLSLMAGAGQAAQHIDAEMVESVYQELGVVEV
jgi:general secretion pathway protein A